MSPCVQPAGAEEADRPETGRGVATTIPERVVCGHNAWACSALPPVDGDVKGLGVRAAEEGLAVLGRAVMGRAGVRAL